MRKDVENLTNRVLATIELGKEYYRPIDLYNKLMEYRKKYRSKLLGNVKVENKNGWLYLDDEKQFIIEVHNKFEGFKNCTEESYYIEGKLLKMGEDDNL